MRYVKSRNKKNGVTYVYEVLECHWDKEKKRSVSKRRLVGKLSDTGEIIPTKSRSKKAPVGTPEPGEAQSTSPDLHNYIQEQREEINLLRGRVSELESKYSQLQNELSAVLASHQKNLHTKLK